MEQDEGRKSRGLEAECRGPEAEIRANPFWYPESILHTVRSDVICDFVNTYKARFHELNSNLCLFFWVHIKPFPIKHIWIRFDFKNNEYYPKIWFSNHRVLI